MLLQIDAYLALTAECTRYVIDLGQYMSRSLFNGWPKARLINNVPDNYKFEDENDYSKWSPNRPYFVTLEGGKVSLYVDKQTVIDIFRDYKTDYARILREKKCTYYKDCRFNRCKKDCNKCELYLMGYAGLAKSLGGDISVDFINDEKVDNNGLLELPDEEHEDVLNKMISEEKNQLLKSVVNSLNNKYKVIIQYTFYEGLNPYEIEKKYRIPHTTVQERLKKALAILKEMLLEYEEFKNN